MHTVSPRRERENVKLAVKQEQGRGFCVLGRIGGRGGKYDQNILYTSVKYSKEKFKSLAYYL